MAKYTVISDVGQAITNVLRSNLVPEPIDRAEKIGICEPKDRGEYIVGIHPYDIKEDLSSQKREPIKLSDGTEQDPPSFLELYYMISVSSRAQIEVKSAEESRIIGKIIQVSKDNRIITKKFLPEDSRVDEIPISMIPLEMEEKVKIWTMFGESYKLSVFYLVGPVAIDSEIIRRPEKRVENFIIGTSQKIPRKIVQFETRIKEEDIDDEYTQDYAKEEEEEEEENYDENEEESFEESEEASEESEESSEEGEESSEEGEESSEGEEEFEEIEEDSEASEDGENGEDSELDENSDKGEEAPEGEEEFEEIEEDSETSEDGKSREDSELDENSDKGEEASEESEEPSEEGEKSSESEEEDVEESENNDEGSDK